MLPSVIDIAGLVSNARPITLGVETTREETVKLTRTGS
jgi:hypothetical protein